MSIEKPNNTPLIMFVSCVTLVIVSVITSIALNNYLTNSNMAKNIDNAIAKGIDPLAVKCAYDKYTSPTCITYALRGK